MKYSKRVVNVWALDSVFFFSSVVDDTCPIKQKKSIHVSTQGVFFLSNLPLVFHSVKCVSRACEKEQDLTFFSFSAVSSIFYTFS